MPKRTSESAKAAEIEASFIAGLEQLTATAKAGGLKALKAKHSRPSESRPQTDWETNSDDAFRNAAYVVFAENAELLRRLA